MLLLADASSNIKCPPNGEMQIKKAHRGCDIIGLTENQNRTGTTTGGKQLIV